MEQVSRTIQCIKQGVLEIQESAEQQLPEAFDYDEEKGKERDNQTTKNE